MKKLFALSFFAIGIFICLMSSTKVFALDRVSMNLTYDGKTYSYDNYKIALRVNNIEVTNLQVPPVIVDDRTYAPVAEIFRSIGAVVDWKPDTKEVYIGYGDRLIVMKVGSKNINNNGKLVEIGVAPLIINGKTMIPVKYAAEAFDFIVNWDDINKTVYVNTENINYPFDTDLPNTSGYDDPYANQDGGSYNEQNSNYADSVLGVDDSSKPKSMELSIDNSTTSIPSINYPETKITSIENIAGTSFVIQASSEISRVERMLLDDNRFVLDIYNAEIALPEKTILINSNEYIKSIRSAQNQLTPVKVTRIVFDLLEPCGFSVSISQDRKSLYFSFLSNSITAITAEKEGSNDVVRITGTGTPGVSITPAKNPDRLVVDLPIAKLEAQPPTAFSGNLISGITAVQKTGSDTQLVISLKSESSYSISYEGNTTVIKVFKPNYKNIEYISATRTIVIKKPVGTQLSPSLFTHKDLYNQYQYILTLPYDLSAYLGYGDYVIKDGYVNSISVKTENGATSIVLNENRILAVDITDDSTSIYIKLMTPKEKYPRVVVIDPGHGGYQPGSIGFGLYEKTLTLDMAYKLKELIEGNNTAKVYMTRIDDSYIDLLTRADFANGLADLFISIHTNAFTNPDVNGTEVYYYKHSNDALLGFSSQNMAEIFQANLLDELNTVDRGVKSAEFVVLKNTAMPAVLCEIEFISNAESAEKLGNESFRWSAMQAMHKSILEVFSIYKPSR